MAKLRWIPLAAVTLLVLACEFDWREISPRSKPQVEEVLPWKNPELSKQNQDSIEQNVDSLGIQKKEEPVASYGKYAGFQQIFADVAEKVIPGVVSIYSMRKVEKQGRSLNQDFPFFFSPRSRPESRRESGLGSGVIISPMGYIMTNNHVILKADLIKIQLSDGREMEAEIVGTDSLSDLAIIRTKEKVNNLPTLELGDSDKLRIGEWVMAVGNPYGLSHTVTTGIISAKGRKTNLTTYENFLQTDAAINPGNSGGALVDLNGKLIGINTAILSRSGGYQGIGLAIPIQMARTIAEDLIENGEVTRGWLGVQIQDLDADLADALGLPDKKGALISDVQKNSPAEKGGLKRGDVILQVVGKQISDANDLMYQVALLKPGKQSSFTIWRDGKEFSLKIKLGKREESKVAQFQEQDANPELKLSFGMSLSNISPELQRRFRIPSKQVTGVLVISIEQGSSADKAGMKPGDVILEAKGKKITDLNDWDRLTEKLDKKAKLLLLVQRGGRSFYIALSGK